MESTKNGRSAESLLPSQQPFSMKDSATGKMRCIADMTLAEIDRNIALVIPALQQAQQAAAAETQLAIGLQILQYEKYRRSLSGLVVPT
jgi:hypothetical protein